MRNRDLIFNQVVLAGRPVVGRLNVSVAVVLLSGLMVVASLDAADPAQPAAKPPQPDDPRTRFFETKIRPILVKHCYECHSEKADEVQGNFRCDTREGLLEGGDNGPAVVPGKPEESFLLSVIRYEEDDYQMPPDARLPDKIIADFEKWIRDGAVDPRTASATTRPRRVIDIEEGRRFWAFQPPRRQAPPHVTDRDWPRGAIDHFVLAKLEQAGIKPAPPAARSAWLRRVTFDLTGLPPTIAEQDSFLADASPQARERVVDRLLASPRFGERWGRHWLDLARYADSNGLDINVTFHHAWRYRDYVIDAFNRDVPYGRFIVEQLAGDLLPFADDAQRTRQLVATGFLVIGPKMLSERDKEKLRMDVVDEQLDTTGRVFLGLTLGCARCHDHKFDPIPTRDYYALAGIFRSTTTIDGIKLGNVFVSGWKVRPLPIRPDHAAALTQHKQRVSKLRAREKEIKGRLVKLAGPGESLGYRNLENLPGVVVDDKSAQRVGSWKNSTYSPNYVGEGYIHDDNRDKGAKSVTFSARLPDSGQYEVRVAYAGANGRSHRVPVTIVHADGQQTIKLDQSKPAAIDKVFQPVGRFRFEKDKPAEVTISNRETNDGHVIVDAVQWLPVGELAKTLAAREPDDSDAERRRQQKEAQRTQQRAALDLQLTIVSTKLLKLIKSAPPPAPMAMAVQDVAKPADGRLHIRGSAHRVSDVIPRGFLQVAAVADSPLTIPSDQSGRLELARWIADPAHPLTARVMVNRVWQHLLGKGLVRSVDNLGHLGERPTHAGLLDHLAYDFAGGGMSVKALVRRIVLSRTYEMSTQWNADAAQRDPANLLLWRYPRRRLAAESIRDSILAAGDQLDLQVGGSAVSSLGERALDNNSKGSIDTEPLTRRSVYLPIIRSDTPAILDVFDFADPEMVTGRRAETTVAAQALLLMNSPFVHRQAERLAASLLSSTKPPQRVEQAYRICFGRRPTDTEVNAALHYIATVSREAAAGKSSRKPTDPSSGGNQSAFVGELTAWSRFCHALLAANEFRYLD